MFYNRGYKHAALTGLGSLLKTIVYKHIVPTGLKSIHPRTIYIVKSENTCIL